MGLDRCVELTRAVELCLSCQLDDCDEHHPDCAFRKYERERLPKQRTYAKRERFEPEAGLTIQDRRGGYVWTILSVNGDGSVMVQRDSGRIKRIRRITDYVRYHE